MTVRESRLDCRGDGVHPRLQGEDEPRDVQGLADECHAQAHHAGLGQGQED